MALTKFALKLLAPCLPGAHVLAFGYPDLLATREEAQKILHCGPLYLTNPNGEAHKVENELAETVEAFKAAGARSTYCVDIRPSRGVETVIDLNEPLWPSKNDDFFDLVIDAGTIEHCANIGQALMNAARMVKPGGYVFHSPPVTMVNHGFYNICPTLLHDFYSQNMWEVLHLSGFKAHRGFDDFSVEATRRGRLPEESALYFLARRPVGQEGLRWPTQTKYLPK